MFKTICAALLAFVVAGVPASMGTSVSPTQYPSEWVGDGVGNTYVLYRRHGVEAMSQGPSGSCVGCAYVKGLETLHGIKFSAEWSYGSSRQHFNWVSNSPGSHCAWAAQAGVDVGALPSYNYVVTGHDLSNYDPSRAKVWERGPPKTLEWFAARYRSSGFVRITTWEELRDAVAQGYPVIVGSSVGYGPRTGQVRDETGLLHSRWWSRWNHAMLICGVSDGVSKRALLLNSWGTSWVTGPKWIGDEPDGSFWATKSDIEKMISNGDTWAILPIIGIGL